MIHDFAFKLAHVLTSYTIPIQKGDFVVINTSLDALPLVDALAKAVLARGGNPAMLLQMPNWADYFMQHATDEQIEFVNPITLDIYEKADVLFNIDAPNHTQHMISVPPKRMALSAKAQNVIQQTFFRRLSDESLRWTLSAWPTPARAQQANQSFSNYERFMYEAYGLHLDDPVKYWMDMAERQGRYVEWLKGKSRVEVRGPGIDLSFEMSGRNWYSCHGNANFPDGEILTCPIEESVNGYVEFNNPAYHAGRRVENVRLVFKDGVVVEASARQGEDYLLTQLNMDENARRLGEFAIGTNDFIQSVTGSVLFDEKIGGTIHMALGQSAAPAEGKNPSRIHWDIVHDMRGGGEIRVDGELMYEGGRFLID